MDAKTKKLMKEFESKRIKNCGKLSGMIQKYIYAHIEKVWQESGFTDIRIGHLPLLSNINQAGVSVNSLAEMAYISKQAISQILKELEEMGYVESITNENDKRVRIVKLTDRGVCFIAKLFECIKNIEKQFASIIGKEKLNQLIEIQYELVCGLYPKLSNVILS